MTGAASTDRPDSPTRARPTLTELGRLIIRLTHLGLRVGLPGRVVAYNATTQLASVSTEILAVFIDETTGREVPKKPLVIDHVPVVFTSNGAGVWQSIPIVPGVTTGELRFQDRAIANWLTTGAPSEPSGAGTHTLTDAIFEPGLHPKTAPITPPTDAVAHVIEGPSVKIGSLAVEPMIKATTFITLMDTMITAAVAAAAPIVPPSGDGGTAGFVALQTAWNTAKATINATKGKVE